MTESAASVVIALLYVALFAFLYGLLKWGGWPQGGAAMTGPPRHAVFWMLGVFWAAVVVVLVVLL